jgi:hypothetical protein
MFQFQDLEEKNEVVKNAFLYLLDKSAGKGMLHAYFVPLVQGQCWGSCALQTGAGTIEHTYGTRLFCLPTFGHTCTFFNFKAKQHSQGTENG